MEKMSDTTGRDGDKNKEGEQYVGLVIVKFFLYL